MWPLVLALQLRGDAPPPSQLPASGWVAPPQPRPLAPRRLLPSGFGRIQVGFGPPAFSPDTGLLRLEGYGGGKVWIEVDAGYMIDFTGRHVGGALWGAVGHWYSPGGGSSPSVNETDYFAGLELPVRFGSPELALFVAPRVGVGRGVLNLGKTAPAQSAFVWGGQVSGVSSRYHLSASVSFLSASVPPPGEFGLPHDLGGLYFAVGGILDDG